MRWTRRAGWAYSLWAACVVLGSVSLAGCEDTEQPARSGTSELPEVITLTSSKATVKVGTQPFTIEVQSAAGKTVLSSLEGAVEGDDIGAYTSFRSDSSLCAYGAGVGRGVGSPSR
ncbi:MAG: hypothetical protein U0165_12810 [Polyangiaceae bacterium]